MKAICITGASQTDLHPVAHLLQQAGLASPKPVKRDDPIDMALWHEQVMAMAAEDAPGYQPISSPGRLWEQLASEIFIANIKSKVWGWADARSTWLLDFWLQFEPRLNFVLVCVTPQQMLASAMTTGPETVSVDEVMTSWQQHHQELLRFHHRHPKRSLLVDSRECAQHPQALIEHCTVKWKLPLSVARDAAGHGYPEQDALALYLAQQLCQNYTQTTSLQHELAATFTRLGEEATQAEAAPNVGTLVLPPEEIIASYRSLRDRTVESHQAQAALEELEGIFLKHEAANKQVDMLTQSNTALSAAKDALAKEKGELTAARDAEAKAKAAALAARDAEAKAKSEALAQRDALTKEIAKVTAARDEQAKLATERQAKIDHLSKPAASVENKAQTEALKAAQSKLKESTQEGELLLLQLHQVQEELENYFLKHQESQKQLETAEARWQRMLKRNLNYCDYETLELLSVQGEGTMQTRWKLKNFETAGRSLPEFEFGTILDQGVAGFVFSRPTGSTGPLLRWPGAPVSQTELTLIPVATPELARERAEALRDLALGDFDLLKTLAHLLRRSLENPAALKAPAGFNADQLKTGLGRFIDLIEKHAKSSLRYDQISLKREQVQPHYESLWLSLGNAAYRDQRWPAFEFRLSCANVRAGQFGLHPKLEFAEQKGTRQLEGWFEEAHDDFGPKLELRFALPGSVDVGVLQRLSENDRKLIVTLLSRLPSMLSALKATGVQLQRPWDDWTKMLNDMQRIIASRLAPPKPIEPPPAQAPVPKVLPAPLPAVAAAKPFPVKKAPVNRTSVSKPAVTKQPVNKPHAKATRPASKRAASTVRKSK
ncbi:MAG: hypothetical protein V4625_02675 [Pseudomonadota bacterium]